MNEDSFKVFIVEDNEWYNKLLRHNITLNPDFQVESYLNARDCLANLHKMPDVITLDYRLPDMSGLELLQKIKKENSSIQVILISEQEDIEVAVKLLKSGAYDYIVKSNEIKDRLLNTLNNIKNDKSIRKELSALKKEIQKKYDFQRSIIGESQEIKNVFDTMSKTLNTNIPIVITGETGTGKDLVAKAIHYNSRRKDRSFVAVNIAAIPSELIESELFGHEKGAFTGATYRRTGKFEEANGGTLFLDEITEISQAFQAKLLRVLQEKEISRIGSNETIPIDCRIMVATNKDLQEEVKQGRFREDLYFRLFGVPIHMPPLRERGKDILLLANHFLKEFCAENNLPEKKFSNEARQKLMHYSYPGNIRELRSIVHLAVVFSGSDEIKPEDITFSSFEPNPAFFNENMTLRDFEIMIVKKYLEKYNNDTKKVAQKLDIGISTIYRMLKEDKREE